MEKERLREEASLFYIKTASNFEKNTIDFFVLEGGKKATILIKG